MRDEFCSDKTFDEEEKSSLNKENIEDQVDKIVVTFGDESDQKIEVTENVMKEKLLSVGIEIENMESFQTEQGKVKVKSLNLLERRKLKS